MPLTALLPLLLLLLLLLLGTAGRQDWHEVLKIQVSGVALVEQAYLQNRTVMLKLG
jgi:hypothetical protein